MNGADRSLERSKVAPELPTVAESGLPGYESLAIYGVFAPLKTPKPIIERLDTEIVRVLARPDVKSLLFKLGMETVGSSPAQLGDKVEDEMNRIGKVIRAAGIKP